jgi:hypothetical protein
MARSSRYWIAWIFAWLVAFPLAVKGVTSDQWLPLLPVALLVAVTLYLELRERNERT